MRLYVTSRGRWAGTQAEARALGREDGGWREVDVPVAKPALLAYLNSHAVGAEPAPQALPPAPAGARPRGARWRVFVKGVFACVVHADNDCLAREVAIAALEVRASA